MFPTTCERYWSWTEEDVVRVPAEDWATRRVSPTPIRPMDSMGSLPSVILKDVELCSTLDFRLKARPVGYGADGAQATRPKRIGRILTATAP